MLKTWEVSFDRMREVLVALPDEALYNADYFPWMDGTALIEAVSIGFLGHFRDDHEPILRDWLAGKPST